MKIRYYEFVDDIDLDALYEAIGFDPLVNIKDNDIGHCLFPDNHSHGDTTGKFAIHRGKKIYNCYKCGGGSLLSLIVELYGWTVEEATRYLRTFAIGDTRSDSEFADHLMKMLGYQGEKPYPIPYFNERVLDKFDGPVDYFRRRGISNEVINDCRLCYSTEVVRTAPIRMRDNESVKIDTDYVGPAAIFPHFWKGRLVGWQSRWIDYPDPNQHRHTDDTFPKWLPKYTNTSSFPKHNSIYNYDWCLTQSDKIVICESVPTVLFLRSNGIPAIAYFGDAPSQEQLKMCRRFTQGVILAPDNDSNGDKLLISATNALQDFIDVWHVPKVGASHDDLGTYADYEDGPQLVKEHLDLAELSYLIPSYY
jgi:hypothetical protein